MLVKCVDKTQTGNLDNMSAAHIAVVTGATGFVATELVKQLLEKGYDVRATVRSTADESKTAFLTKLGAAFPGKLQLYEADLMVPGSFDGAISGATFVFHVASPFRIDVQDAQRDLIEPAVHGTRNVLSSVAKHKGTVQRTVVTSSVAGMQGTVTKCHLELKQLLTNHSCSWWRQQGVTVQGAAVHRRRL